MRETDFKNELQNKMNYINERLDKLICIEYPEQIYEAMRYSVFAGGKRLRPVLMLSAHELLKGDYSDAVNFACALEMIHTYSLIHDDLPSMDNDDFRRGKPTCHRAFDEGIAVLAGDALLNKAFEIMSEETVLKKELCFAKAMSCIAKAAGTRGMIGGQVVDVISENKAIDDKTLTYIHLHKTAALIGAALKAGAVLGGASERQMEMFDVISRNIGMAFQIKDDILDVTSTDEVLGKPVFSDQKNNKTTYVTMYGMEKAENDLKLLTEEAENIIAGFGEKGEFLREYFSRLVTRVK